MRNGTLKALVPGRYNKAGKAICAMRNHSGKPHGGAVATLPIETRTGLHDDVFAGVRTVLSMGPPFPARRVGCGANGRVGPHYPKEPIFDLTRFAAGRRPIG